MLKVTVPVWNSTDSQHACKTGGAQQMASFPEIALSRWWSTADLSQPLRTSKANLVTIVYRGTWSHGIGPDFQEAMIDFGDGHLHVGSIEIHRFAADWVRHGHHLDPAYDDCILHAVLENDLMETRTSGGRIVPTTVLPVEAIELQSSNDQAFDWNRVGGDVCAEEIAATKPALIRQTLHHLGDLRFAAKAARLEASLIERNPAQVLYEEIFDGLGYMANREPMKRLSRTLPLWQLEQMLSSIRDEPNSTASLALILGVAGFLPLSPKYVEVLDMPLDEISAIERIWTERGLGLHANRLPETAWKTLRVRPGNHPLRRLRIGALLVAQTTGGLVHDLLEPLRSGTDPVVKLRQLTSVGNESLLGKGRAYGIVANSVIPFALAYARVGKDQGLTEAASMAWEHLPAAESNQITRRAMRQVCGGNPVRSIGARGQQGLIHLDSTLCGPRRCFECPIAGLVQIESASRTQATS